MWQKVKASILSARRIFAVFGVILLIEGAIMPILSTQAYAAQVTDRSLNISSGQPSATNVTYSFSFVPATSSVIQGMMFEACTTAIGTCTAPTGLSFSSATGPSFTGTWTDSTDAFSIDGTGGGACTPSASVLCVKRTSTTAETGTAQRGLSFGGITNPAGTDTGCTSQPNCTFFVRMFTYSDTAYATQVDYGTVASSVNGKLTVSAIVEEELSFCVGATSVNDATSSIPACKGITGTSLNLGVLNNTVVSVSPVQNIPSEGGDNNNGLAELSTNSADGTTVAYDAIQQPGTYHKGALRVQGATCNSGVVNTDQCINSIGATAATLTNGTEDFGMAIGGVNCSLVTASGAYTCNFANGSFNLDPTAQYACNGITNVGSPTNTFDPDHDQIAGTTSCKYAWDETGTSETIATSAGAVGGEGLILKFAATPNLVTPTGTYTAQADFVATPSY